MIVIARPGPGSPVFCVATGRFFDLTTAQEVVPSYSDVEFARYQYVLPTTC